MRIKISIFGGVLHIFSWFRIILKSFFEQFTHESSLELEQYSVSKPRNDNIVKHYGDSDQGKNKAFRKSFRKNTGFQNVPHVYETTDSHLFEFL
jgi:hypothetical protein